MEYSSQTAAIDHLEAELAKILEYEKNTNNFNTYIFQYNGFWSKNSLCE